MAAARGDAVTKIYVMSEIYVGPYRIASLEPTPYRMVSLEVALLRNPWYLVISNKVECYSHACSEDNHAMNNSYKLYAELMIMRVLILKTRSVN